MSYFQEIILRHARNPLGLGRLPDPAETVVGTSPLCGDMVEMYGKINEKGEVQLGFESQGCALCRASASILLGEVNTKKIQDVSATLAKLIPLFKELVALESPPWSESVAALSDLRRFPSRLSCVLLPWETLQKTLDLLQK